MKVRDQIAVLQKAIDQLKLIDPTTEMSGHYIHPDGCYSGDLSGPIYNITVEHTTEEELRADASNEEEAKYLIGQYAGVALNVYHN